MTLGWTAHSTTFLCIAAGTDPKSVAINLASFMLFLVPFVAYLYAEHFRNYALAVAACFACAYLLAPMGWKRPHPYSDMPENRPKKA